MKKNDVIVKAQREANLHIANYEHNKRLFIKEQRGIDRWYERAVKDVEERYKGALGAQPGGHPEGGHVTGDPEKRLLEIERLKESRDEKHRKLETGVLAKKIEAVGIAFNDLRAVLYPDADKEIDKLIKAIMAACENRYINPYHGIQQKFRLCYGIKTFKQARYAVRDKVIELLQLGETDYDDL